LPARLGPIAVIAPCPFPANHGTPGSIREIVQVQVRKGYDIHVFTYPFGDELPLDPHVRLHRAPMLGWSRRIKVGPMWRRPWWNLLIVLKICSLASKYRFRVIHAYNYEGGLFGWLAHLWLRRPLVFHHFNTMIDELPSYNFIKPAWLATWLARALDYWVPRMATRIIAISDAIEQFLVTQGIDPRRIVKIPMGIDPSIFKNHDGRTIRQEYGLGDRPVIMYAGLLNRFQRLDYLLQGMSVVRQARPDARLVLVTNYIEPEDHQECLRLLSELQLKDVVVITRPEPLERLPDYLAAADVCVVSRPDCPGVAIKMLNYMGAGKAIVVPEGSSMGLVHGQDAYIVRDHDGAAIGRGVLDLLSDETLRRHLGENAAVSLERRFGLETICTDIGRLYVELVR
jgi:glycosyltransferase involved in cell wall biosynthesis